jgi:hypothetical protein
MIPREARKPVVAALAVWAIGWGLVWVGAVPFERAPEEVCDTRLVEGAGYRLEPALLPPGATTCVVRAPDGSEQENLYVPWLEWLTVALVATGAGLGVAALTTPRHRGMFAFGWLCFSICGLAAWFADAAAALALLATAVGLAVLAAAVRARQLRGPGGSPAG